MRGTYAICAFLMAVALVTSLMRGKRRIEAAVLD
jgi:hypothetical protein